jgi:CRISPR-associated protein Cmr3
MTIDLVLSPRDGLTLKDARGFDLAGGVTAGGLPWPGPATTAGAARAVVGRLQGLSETYGDDKESWLNLVEEVTVCGPIIVSRPLDREAWIPLWPRPHDAVCLPHARANRHGEPKGELHWLEPRPRGTARWRVRGVWDGDPEDDAIESLWLPLPEQRDKPMASRLLWPHQELMDWLEEPCRRDDQPSLQPMERVDIHLAIDADTLAVKDEHLFAHSTYESLIRLNSKDTYELGMALRIGGVEETLDLTQPVWRIGGEGRFATASRLDPAALEPDRHLIRRWKDTPFLRLLLVTPARFGAGWRPDWLKPTASGSGCRFEGVLPGLDRPVALRAAFMDRATWMSGWDLAERRPKVSAACVPAGAVYYFESLAEPFTADDARRLWLSSLQQPGEVAAHEGFGLALPGRWPITA